MWFSSQCVHKYSIAREIEKSLEAKWVNNISDFYLDIGELLFFKLFDLIAAKESAGEAANTTKSRNRIPISHMILVQLQYYLKMPIL
jgi:hypothetical protein